MGTYRLGRRFAIGGMAEVYLARTVGVGGFSKPVAVKRVLPHMAEDATFVEHFMQEARLTESLQHRNIVQVLDLGTHAGEPYMILELVDGENLRTLLKECARTGQRLTLREAICIAMQVAEGLAHAHESTSSDGRPLGLVHRDVNPSNVLLSAAGEVKLADFGIARAAEMQSDTQAGVVKGKPGYLSPELVRGQPAGQHSDVFLLGLLLHELLTGTALFHGLPFFQAIARIKAFHPSQLERPPGLPNALWSLLCHTLMPDPAERVGSARAFANALEDLLFAERMRVGSRDLAALLARILPERVSLLRDMGLQQGRLLTLDPWSVSLGPGRSARASEPALVAASAMETASAMGVEEVIDPDADDAVDAIFLDEASAELHGADEAAEQDARVGPTRAAEAGDASREARASRQGTAAAGSEGAERVPDAVERGEQESQRSGSGTDRVESGEVSRFFEGLEASGFLELSGFPTETEPSRPKPADPGAASCEPAAPTPEATAFLEADEFELIDEKEGALLAPRSEVYDVPSPCPHFAFEPAEMDALLDFDHLEQPAPAEPQPAVAATEGYAGPAATEEDAEPAGAPRVLSDPTALPSPAEVQEQAEAASAQGRPAADGDAWQHLLAATLQAMAPQLGVHGAQVATLAVRIATRLGLAAPEIGEVRLAALTLAVGSGIGPQGTPTLHQLKALLGAHWQEASAALEGCGLFGSAIAERGPGLALAAALEVSRTGNTPHEYPDLQSRLEAIRREGRLPAWALPALEEALGA